LEQRGDPGTRIRFTGTFAGKSVTWDATLYTLRDYVRLRRESGEPDLRCARPFIEVAGGEGTLLSMRIGLPVTAIDEPTIRKAIIMVRQYRLLAVGHHEFGDPYCI
jgi:hypothetical protein